MSASTSAPESSSPLGSHAVENLIALYSEFVDAGDFAGVGRLLVHATFTSSSGTVSGAEAVESVLRENIIIYDDGTPRTKHIVTNIRIEVDEGAGAARAWSYFTALQAVKDFVLQPIVSGRYHDRFERRAEAWCFIERRVITDLIGDVSHHLRPSTTRR